MATARPSMMPKNHLSPFLPLRQRTWTLRSETIFTLIIVTVKTKRYFVPLYAPACHNFLFGFVAVSVSWLTPHRRLDSRNTTFCGHRGGLGVPRALPREVRLPAQQRASGQILSVEPIYPARVAPCVIASPYPWPLAEWARRLRPHFVQPLLASHQHPLPQLHTVSSISPVTLNASPPSPEGQSPPQAILEASRLHELSHS